VFIMKSMIGYTVAIVGIAVMALGFGIIPIKIALFDGISGNIISGAGIVLIIIGVAFAMLGEKIGGRKKDNFTEVPIYEGKGKDRRIVGYQRNARK